MLIDQDAVMQDRGLASIGEDGRTLTYDIDPRINDLSGFLRKYSIDELPQLLNVFIGDMSLVGPRPLVVSMLADLHELREARSVIRPGITGLWQIRHRQKNVSAVDMIEDDLEYIRDWNFVSDFKILWLTIPRLFVL